MKYRVELRYPDGEVEPNDELFDNPEDAEQYGLNFCGNYAMGGEILNFSNPGDYPLEEVGGNCDFEVIEVD